MKRRHLPLKPTPRETSNDMQAARIQYIYLLSSSSIIRYYYSDNTRGTHNKYFYV